MHATFHFKKPIRNTKEINRLKFLNDILHFNELRLSCEMIVCKCKDYSCEMSM